MSTNVLRIGIGGPVGSGKTALTEALVPILIEAGRHPGVITNDIYTQEDAQHVRRELAGILDPERVIGVETGACPHTAVRDDPTMNLAAGEDLLEQFPEIDTLIYESGGDNLTLTFSPPWPTCSSSCWIPPRARRCRESADPGSPRATSW
ncbi:GTP-binding protein [Branchiibius cervicis]|uniref:GTP-binding protein n=1 Tax=Branchiibius cervicis TaxID=908252 RepID=A0ABW2AQ55_9MICO